MYRLRELLINIRQPRQNRFTARAPLRLATKKWSRPIRTSQTTSQIENEDPHRRGKVVTGAILAVNYRKAVQALTHIKHQGDESGTCKGKKTLYRKEDFIHVLIS